MFGVDVVCCDLWVIGVVVVGGLWVVCGYFGCGGVFGFCVVWLGGGGVCVDGCV